MIAALFFRRRQHPHRFVSIITADRSCVKPESSALAPAYVPQFEKWQKKTKMNQSPPIGSSPKYDR
jgi:hypothetical protein